MPGIRLARAASPPAPARAAVSLPESGAAPTDAHSRLGRSLRRILKSPSARGAFWGVYVYSLSRHRVLFDHDGDKWFTPASNGKLFTLAAALRLIGADYRFHTVLESRQAPTRGGVIEGNVVLAGEGDPSLSGRHYPYRYVPPPAPGAPPRPAAAPYDTFAAARRLARLLVARGVKRITGNIVGDDSYYAYEPYPPGWSEDDMPYGYGAPVSALTMNDNQRFLLVDPGSHVGAPARLRIDPAIDPPVLLNRTVTAPAGTPTDIELEENPQGAGLIVTGQIGLGASGDVEEIAVHDPARFAARMLRHALIAEGIQVDGAAEARHRPETETGAAASPATSAPLYQLASLASPPLAQILQVTAKVSQNLEAELMLRLLGKLRGSSLPPLPHPGWSRAAPPNEREQGRRVVQDFLRQAGLGATDVFMTDGSGLSRYDLVTPSGVVRLLRYMSQQPGFATWEALLPVAAVDGTLDDRFHGTVAAGRLHAKTGTLSHDTALSGYVTTASGDRRVFSLLSNNDDEPSGAARRVLDRMAVAIASQ